jgi:hypothetical protein
MALGIHQGAINTIKGQPGPIEGAGQSGPIKGQSKPIKGQPTHRGAGHQDPSRGIEGNRGSSVRFQGPTTGNRGQSGSIEGHRGIKGNRGQSGPIERHRGPSRAIDGLPSMGADCLDGP